MATVRLDFEKSCETSTNGAYCVQTWWGGSNLAACLDRDNCSYSVSSTEGKCADGATPPVCPEVGYSYSGGCCAPEVPTSAPGATNTPVPPTPTVCVPVNPGKPVLFTPDNGYVVNVGDSVALNWNDVTWGNGCPNNNTYRLCVGSTNPPGTTGENCIYNDGWKNVPEPTKSQQRWTPSTGTSRAYWRIAACNPVCTRSDWKYFCVEDVLSCTPACGQARKCSAACSNDDGGVPGTPVISYPIGTSSTPIILSPGTTGVTLSLEGTAFKADVYYYWAYDDGVYFMDTGSPNTSVGITGLTSGNLYSWRSRSVNTTCISAGETSPASDTGYFKVNSAPTIVKIQVANSDIALVPNDNTTDNHICKSEFTGTTKPREVVFGIFINDPDGVGDSGSPPVLHWNGQDYPSAWTGTGGGNNSAQVRVDYASFVGEPPQSLHEVTATYSDRWGATVGSTLPVSPANRLNWKVWDCQVPTNGTLFKASDAIQSCPAVGFSEPIDVGVSFDSIIFSDTPDVTMTVAKPANYGTNSIVWGKNYHPLINGVAVPRG